MTRAEYETYQTSVEAFFLREGVNTMSEPADAFPFFSSCPCDCCGRRIAGERHELEADHGGIYEVCIDCLYYNEYGNLGDTIPVTIGA